MTEMLNDLSQRLRTISWQVDHVEILDQTQLPGRTVYRDLHTIQDSYEAIQTLQVRGAPLIGVTASYGLYLGMRNALASGASEASDALARCSTYLASARPTAVNLFWALRRAEEQVTPLLDSPAEIILETLLHHAHHVLDEDVQNNRSIGLHTLPLLRGKRAILTHCNAGWLATAGYGTATAGLYLMREQGERLPHVYVDETRPVLQGARLTAWELNQAEIPLTLITDNMAASVMAQGRVEAVIVGCDRMAANGDFANKIGTLGVAILAREMGIPFYAAVPTSSIDFALPEGSGIPIEERAASEVRMISQEAIAPDVHVYNPAFDVTPHRYVSGVITEHGVVRAPFDKGLAAMQPE